MPTRRCTCTTPRRPARRYGPDLLDQRRPDGRPAASRCRRRWAAPPSPPTPCPRPAANTWTQVTIPLSTLGRGRPSQISTASGSRTPAASVRAGLLRGRHRPDAGRSAPPPRHHDHAWTPGRTATRSARWSTASPTGTPSSLADLNAPLNRQGGNNTSRYNWQLNADNRASDYFFESIGDAERDARRARRHVHRRRPRPGGAQAHADHPDARLGRQARRRTAPSCRRSRSPSTARSRRPTRTCPMPATASSTDGTQRHRQRPQRRQRARQRRLPGGLDQPPCLASGGRRRRAASGTTSWTTSRASGTARTATSTRSGRRMDEIKNDILAYGAQGQGRRPDGRCRRARGVGLVRLLLQRLRPAVRRRPQLSGPPGPRRARRHGLPALAARPAPPERRRDGQALAGRVQRPLLPAGRRVQRRHVDQRLQLLRNRSTRQLWDPNYVSESWINDKVMLIPRLKGWVSAYYPGTKTAITEYNWGAEGSINGATTQADIFGIFGREGLDLATRWTTPAPGTPTYKAMKLYRNYDGSKSGFGDTQRLRHGPRPGQRLVVRRRALVRRRADGHGHQQESVRARRRSRSRWRTSRPARPPRPGSSPPPTPSPAWPMWPSAAAR